MLISGADHHLVGLGTMAEVEDDVQKTKPGYEGYLNDSALSIAELLRDSGYHTYMAGKWHLGLYGDDAHSPKTRGFESSFALLSGASSHFAPVAGRPLSTDGDPYRDNGVAVTLCRQADRIHPGERRGSKTPFCLRGVHRAALLQAPPDYIDRYQGKYAQGYAVIQQLRLAKQKQLGIIPADFQANPGLPDSVNTPTWDSLTTDQQAIEARKMEVYAAMVENLDANIGGIIQAIKDASLYDNTFVFFESDDGAEGEPSQIPLEDNTDNSLGGGECDPLPTLEVLPQRGRRLCTSDRAHPGPSGRASGVHAVHPRDRSGADVLALAGAANPGSCYNGHVVHPLTGVSLLPALADAAVVVRSGGMAIEDELFGRKYVLQSNWKATWIEQPWGSGAWALYDVGTDRAEVNDLASAMPDVVSNLSALYDDYATRVGVVPPAQIGNIPPEGTAPVGP